MKEDVLVKAPYLGQRDDPDRSTDANTGRPFTDAELPAGTGKDGEPNGLGYGRQLSRQFAAYLKQFEIEKGTAFHAFRHTMSTRLAEAMGPKTTIALITGYARRQEVPTLEKHYNHIADVQTLPERVEALTKFNSDINFTEWAPHQFASALVEVDSLHP